MYPQILKIDGKLSYKIKDYNKKTGEHYISVIDVRDGEAERQVVKNRIKTNMANRGSVHMKPSYSVMGRSYQNSHRKI